MQTKEYCQFWHHPQLDVGLLQAYHVDYAYPRHSHDHYVICVVDWIEAHFAGPISLADLTNYVALSPYYLLRVFHEQVGLPPHAYLQDVRIRRAQRLIELGKPLAEVTTCDVGHCDRLCHTNCRCWPGDRRTYFSLPPTVYNF